MPMSRYQIRNEYSLADPELHNSADKDDPEALLEGVAMAGLVGVLRQLGDLAEFAAEIFHDLHEEVMATATRGHGLMVRVQQLEAEFPSIEKAFLSQTNHVAFFSNAGTDWHPSLHKNQNLITRGDLPRFIRDSYEECRGPPRLFLLDKFDVAGAGACLKRYTDPSFFKVEASSYGLTSAEVQREKKSRKAKKKGSRWRNGGTPEVLPTSHAKLHQLFLEEHVENGVSDPARLVKLKRRLNGFPFDSKTGKSYMAKFINTSALEDKVVHEISFDPSSQELPSKITSESALELLEASAVSSLVDSAQRKRSPYSSPSVERTVLRSYMDEVREDLSDGELSSEPKQYSESDTRIISPTIHEVAEEKEIAVDGVSKTDGSKDGYQSDDIASEVDNYVDALATMDSEIETDTEFRTKSDLRFLNIGKQGTDSDANEELLQAQFSDSQSLGNSTASDNGNSSFKKGISSFSYSDTGSTSVESIAVDVDVSPNILPSTEICKAEITYMSLEVPMSEELTVSQHPKNESSHKACIEVAEIPIHGSKLGVSSPSLCLAEELAQKHLQPLDQGEVSARGTLRGPELVEISPNHDELDYKSFRSTKNETNQNGNIPWKSRHSDLPSQTRDDDPPTYTVCAEPHLVVKLDDEDPGVLSNASLHFPNILEVVPKKYSSESSLDNVVQTENAEDSCTKNLVASHISSPHSVISQAEDQPFEPALEFETCNTDLQPEVIDSADDATPSAREATLNSTLASDNSSDPYFTAQQGPERTDEVPPKIGSVEFGTCCPEETLDRVLSKADGEQMVGVSPSRNFTGYDSTKLEISSGISKCTGTGSLTDSPIDLDEKEIEMGQSENVIVPALVASHDNDADEVDSSSKRNSQEEYLLSIQKSDQIKFEVYDDRNKSGKQKEIINYEIASPNSDSELVSYVPESSLAAEAELRLHPDEATRVSSSKYNEQDSESTSSQQTNLHENSDDAPSPPHLFFNVRSPFEQKLTRQADQLDTEHSHVDATESKEISQSDQVQSPDHIDGDEASFESSSNLEYTQFTNHTDHDIFFNASPKSSSMHLPTEASELEFSQPDSHEVGIPDQDRYPLSSVSPGFSILSEVPEIILEEMPPPPPLPPVQWTIGRPQHASLTSDRDAVQNTLGVLSPMFPSEANINSKMGYHTLNGDGLLPPAPILPFSAVAVEGQQHVNEHLVGNVVHSSPSLMQIPTIFDDRDSQYDFFTSGSTANLNPFLTLPSTSKESPQHGLHAGEVGSTRPSFSSFSTVTTSGDTSFTQSSSSLHEIPSHPLHHLQPEASLVNEEPERTSVSLGIRMIKFPDTNLLQPTVADGQLQYVSTTSEGEIVWSTSTSLFPVFEDGMVNGNRPMKLLRPRSPLIDDLVTHDKNKMRNAKERALPEVRKFEDNLLQQILDKSNNLKPVGVIKHRIPHPKANNVRVAAILEKAESIRQAHAGSDEENWSD